MFALPDRTISKTISVIALAIKDCSDSLRTTPYLSTQVPWCEVEVAARVQISYLCKQTLGRIVNTVLPRVAKTSFVVTDDGGVDVYHSNCKQKKETPFVHLRTCLGNSMILTTAYVVPMQSLSLKLEATDFIAGGMKFLIDRWSTICIACTYHALWDQWAY